jgi:hypothetical protein
MHDAGMHEVERKIAFELLTRDVMATGQLADPLACGAGTLIDHDCAGQGGV